MKDTNIRCSKCGHKFAECAVRHCPHPAVKDKFDGEETYICIYCCRGCKFAGKSELCGALGCGYKSKGVTQ